MEPVLVLACAVGGLGAGAMLPPVIERVPARRPLRGAGILGATWRPARRRSAPVEVRWAPLATAVVWAAVAARLGLQPALPAFLVLATVLVAVAAIDLRHYVVPNRIVAPALAAGLVLLLLAAAVAGEWGRFGSAVLGAVAAFNALLVIHLVQPRGMGLGDVKLAAVLGLHLGWFGLGHVAVGLFLGFGLGAVVGLGLVAAGRRGRRDHVPFAPFLAAGTVLAVVVGEPLLRWYGGL